MKEVLYIGGFNLPDKNAAAQRVIANAKILRELNYTVKLVGLTQDKQSLEPFEYEGFKCVNLLYPKTALEWIRMLASIRQYIPYYTEKTSIVIAYNHPAIALKKLLDYNRKKGIKTLSDCTEWYEPNGGLIFKAIKGWDINKRMYDIHPRLDGIITISRFLDDFYKDRGVNTLLLPPLVDKQAEKWNKKQKGSSNIINMLYAGSPEGSKDRLDFVINALSIVASKGRVFTLDIIGITESQYRDIYLNGRQERIPDFVFFRGRVSHEEVLNKLKSADFQIFLREDHLANRAGFPTKFAETISAGTIVLTNPSSNLKDYMKEGVNSFELNISSEDALVDSLMKPLALTKKEIDNIKNRIDTDLFDYRQYIEKTSIFLATI